MRKRGRQETGQAGGESGRLAGRKRCFSRIGALALAAFLLIGTCTEQSLVRAEQAPAIGAGAGDQGGPAIGSGAKVNVAPGPVIGPEEGDGGQPAEKEYSLTADRPAISFGTVSEGDTVKSQAIHLQNTGSLPVSLCWNETDPEDAFAVDSTGSYEIAAGGGMDFYVAPRSGLPAGSYSCTFLFGDSSDPGYVKGVTVTASVTVVPKQPYITGMQISPSSVSVAKGNTYGFQAQVSGENNPDLSVRWTVSGQKSSDTSINKDGVLNVAANEGAGALTVKAVSVMDSSVSATASVTLTGGSYNVTVSASPAAGGSVTGGGAVNAGGSMTVTASANNGYRFEGWTVNGAGVTGGNSYQITNIQGNVTAVASFTQSTVKVKVDVNHSHEGTVTGGGTVAVGGSMGISAKPKDGYVFEGWEEGGKTVSKELSLQLKDIRQDRHLTACFSKETCHVKLVSNPAGAGLLKGGGSYKKGKNVTVSAEAVKGYEFVSWSKQGKVIGQKREITIQDIDEDYCLTANFRKTEAKTYEITAGIAGNGGVISPGGVTEVEAGGHITYTIAPQSGYRILAVAVDDVQVGPQAAYTFTNVKANHKIVAAFAEKEDSSPAGGQAGTESGSRAPQGSGQADSGQSGSLQGSGGAAYDGDVYVEGAEDDYKAPQMDMDLTAAPEESSGNDLDGLTGVLQTENLTADEARALLATPEEARLLQAAVSENYLQITVNNQFAAYEQETETAESMANPSVKNLSEVVSAVLTEEEKMEALKGNPVSLNLDISDSSKFISKEDKEVIDRAKEKGHKVGRYFEIVFLKTANGNTEQIEKMSTPVEVVLRVPDDIWKEGREYAILRVHGEPDGSYKAATIADMDDNADTITFRTDRFSSYAILYTGNEGNAFGLLEWGVVSLGMLFIVAAAVILAGKAVQRRKFHSRTPHGK